MCLGYCSFHLLHSEVSLVEHLILEGSHTDDSQIPLILWVPGEGWPLFDVFDVFVDVELGAWVGAGPKIQHHYEVLAIWLRTRLS